MLRSGGFSVSESNNESDEFSKEQAEPPPAEEPEVAPELSTDPLSPEPPVPTPDPVPSPSPQVRLVLVLI